MRNLRKVFTIILSLPRTVWFNLRYLPFRQALRLPVWLAPNVRVKELYRGGIVIYSAGFNSTHIGFHNADAVDCYGSHTVISVEKGGIWHVSNDMHIGRGAIIHVKKGGRLSVGRNFAISGTTSIICSNSIEIGNDVQFSWNSLVMDSDAHRIYGEDEKLVNPSAPISIGNKVWIAANTSILKKAGIGDNCVVAGNSLVNRKIEGSNQIVAGIPAKPIKKISSWEL